MIDHGLFLVFSGCLSKELLLKVAASFPRPTRGPLELLVFWLDVVNLINTAYYLVDPFGVVLRVDFFDELVGLVTQVVFSRLGSTDPISPVWSNHLATTVGTDLRVRVDDDVTALGQQGSLRPRTTVGSGCPKTTNILCSLQFFVMLATKDSS